MIKHALQETVKIVSHAEINRGYFRIALGNSRISSFARPGQFVMVNVNEGDAPLLRRPLGIHSVKKKNIEILYEVVGAGTEILSRKKPGGKLDIIGPLGNGFDYRSPLAARRSPVLVAGGIGVAPLLFLAERLVDSPQSLVHSRPLVLIGGRNKDKILCAKEFEKIGCFVAIATDNGSKGFKGKVTDLLGRLLLTMDYRLSTIYACGPAPMLKKVSGLSKKYGIPAQVSLEAHMACGFGACLGCVVDTVKGYKRVCKDGPVFTAAEVIYS